MPEMKLDLLKMSGTGTGEINSTLSQLLPLSASLPLHSDLTMGVGTGAQQQTMNMNIDVEVHLQTK
jgi:hypothetical protein